MSNILFLNDNPRFLKNRHSVEVDGFAEIAQHWDKQTLNTWLEVSKHAEKHMGYHCQMAYSPEDVVMLCDMAVEMGWMSSIMIIIKRGDEITQLPPEYSTQIYAVKTISKDIHKLYMRVDLGMPILRCLLDKQSGVLVAGSTVEYPNWLHQVKEYVVCLGQQDPEKAFLAMSSYTELYKSWDKGRSPREHVESMIGAVQKSTLLSGDHTLVKEIMNIHPDWPIDYACGYASFLAGVQCSGEIEDAGRIKGKDVLARGWSDAKKIHEIPFTERITA